VRLEHEVCSRVFYIEGRRIKSGTDLILCPHQVAGAHFEEVRSAPADQRGAFPVGSDPKEFFGSDAYAEK